MKAYLSAFFAALMLCTSYAYHIEQSRDDLLAKYYIQVDQKIPKSARMIVGDERVNAYIGQSVVGIETKRGELYSFEYAPVKNPSITIIVSDEAARMIEEREMGVLEAIGNGGIKIKTSSWFSAFKVEALKRAYDISGIDKRLTDKSIPEKDIYQANSLFMSRPRFTVWN